jgi:hypothetical protein
VTTTPRGRRGTALPSGASPLPPQGNGVDTGRPMSLTRHSPACVGGVRVFMRSRFPMRCGAAGVALVVVACVASNVPVAEASFPGRNGAIVYGWNGESTYRAGPYPTSIRAVRPRSGRVRVIRDCPLVSDGGPVSYAPCIVGGPRVSPDGLRVAFRSIQVVINYPNPWQYQPALGVIAWDGTGLEEHARESQLQRLAWSPGGEQLLLDRQVTPGSSAATAVFLASVDGTELRQVTPEFTASPDWSSTGWIAFIHYSSDPNCQPHCSDIWVTRLGETPRRVTYRGGHSPAWSPHGTKLAFVRVADGRENVYLLGRDGHGLRRLTRRGGSGPCWSPDGKWIAFNRNGDLYVVRTDGRDRRRIVAGMLEFGEGPHVTEIDWQALPQR